MGSLDRLQSWVAGLIESVTDRRRLSDVFREKQAPLSGLALDELAEMLLSRKGEASGSVLAQLLLQRYSISNQAEKRAFLHTLVRDFGPDEEIAKRALAAYIAVQDGTIPSGLHGALEPRRQELLRRLNLAAGGTASLVRMREDLLDFLRSDPSLAALDEDFVHLFKSWFNRGFLVLRAIDWSTPALVLEKIIQYEAVHEIKDWNDLRNRLAPGDRRCYGFFHPQMPDVPLIFVEVALTVGIPDAIQPLLSVDRTPLALSDVSTAVFYSISNTQRGLSGVSFGNFLIKQVVDDLRRDIPSLNQFVTLSPVPGFSKWLSRELQNAASSFIGRGAREKLELLDGRVVDGLRTDQTLRKEFQKLAARYFLEAKDNSGRPVDPVARFHLGNGARLEQLNVLGDLSPNGLRQSHGLMVNYLYALDEIEANHERFAETGSIIAAPSIIALANEERAVRTFPLQSAVL